MVHGKSKLIKVKPTKAAIDTKERKKATLFYFDCDECLVRCREFEGYRYSSKKQTLYDFTLWYLDDSKKLFRSEMLDMNKLFFEKFLQDLTNNSENAKSYFIKSSRVNERILEDSI